MKYNFGTILDRFYNKIYKKILKQREFCVIEFNFPKMLHSKLFLIKDPGLHCLSNTSTLGWLQLDGGIATLTIAELKNAYPDINSIVGSSIYIKASVLTSSGRTSLLQITILITILTLK